MSYEFHNIKTPPVTMVSPDHSFHVADYCVFGITIAVSLVIGIYYALSGGKQRTTSEYFVGNRKMAILPVAISLLVSFESSILMLGYPAEIYVYGIQAFWGTVGFFIANILSIIVIVPLMHPLKITSAYEYLELRFESHAVRILGTILAMFGYTGYMGIVLFGPATALEAVTGLPQWVSITSIAAAAVVYTSIGGLKAVIWTDVFQFIVMYAGFFAVIARGTIKIGGVSRTWEIAKEKGRLNFFNFNPDPTLRQSFWSLVIGTMIRGFGLVFNQSSIQRISSTPTVAAARRVLCYVAPGFLITGFLAIIEGIIAYGYYDTVGCDPLASKQIANPNQIMPFMVMDIFEGLPGLPGLFMAALFSASLSTISSGLSSLSAQFWTDLVKPHVKPMSEFRATVIAKLAVVFFGGLITAVAFMTAVFGGTLNQIAASLLSAFGGPLTGLFVFGSFCPWGNATGGFWGTILAAIVTFLISFGQMTTKGSVKDTRLPPAPMDQCPSIESFSFNMTNMTTTSYLFNTTTEVVTTIVKDSYFPEPTGFRRLFMVSFHWFGVIGILLPVIFGSIISLCTGYKKPGEVDKRYIISFYDRLFPCLPECILKPLRCGYTFKSEDDKLENKPEEEIIAELYNIEAQVPLTEGINSTKPSDNDVPQIVNGTAVCGDDYIDTNMSEALVKEGKDDVTMSVDDVTFRKIPVKDIEMEIL